MFNDPHTPRKIPGRVEWISPSDDAERLRKIRQATERMSYRPEDSSVDYDEPEFRAVAPAGWDRRRG